MLKDVEPKGSKQGTVDLYAGKSEMVMQRLPEDVYIYQKSSKQGTVDLCRYICKAGMVYIPISS